MHPFDGHLYASFLLSFELSIFGTLDRRQAHEPKGDRYHASEDATEAGGAPTRAFVETSEP